MQSICPESRAVAVSAAFEPQRAARKTKKWLQVLPASLSLGSPGSIHTAHGSHEMLKGTWRTDNIPEPHFWPRNKDAQPNHEQICSVGKSISKHDEEILYKYLKNIARSRHQKQTGRRADFTLCNYFIRKQLRATARQHNSAESQNQNVVMICFSPSTPRMPTAFPPFLKSLWRAEGQVLWELMCVAVLKLKNENKLLFRK